MLAAMTESAPDKDDTTPSVPPASKPATVARAKSMTLKGLTQKEGKPFATDITLSEITPTVPMEGATLSLKSVGFEGMNDVTGRYVAGSFTKDGAAICRRWSNGASGRRVSVASHSASPSRRTRAILGTSTSRLQNCPSPASTTPGWGYSGLTASRVISTCREMCLSRVRSTSAGWISPAFARSCSRTPSWLRFSRC